MSSYFYLDTVTQCLLFVIPGIFSCLFLILLREETHVFLTTAMLPPSSIVMFCVDDTSLVSARPRAWSPLTSYSDLTCFTNTQHNHNLGVVFFIRVLSSTPSYLFPCLSLCWFISLEQIQKSPHQKKQSGDGISEYLQMWNCCLCAFILIYSLAKHKICIKHCLSFGTMKTLFILF